MQPEPPCIKHRVAHQSFDTTGRSDKYRVSSDFSATLYITSDTVLNRDRQSSGHLASVNMT